MAEIQEGSDTLLLGDSGQTVVETTRVTHFVDGERVDEVNPIDPMTGYLSTHESDLANFLSRPVEIYSTTWAEGSFITKTIDPWAHLMNNEGLHAKLVGYARFRANLKIKVLINASPFQYSGLLVSYKPMGGFSAGPEGTSLYDESRDYSGGHISNYVDTTASLMARSTRPGTLLNPAEQSEYEMAVPFVYNYPWFDLADYVIRTVANPSDTITGLGILTIQSIQPLYSVASTVGDPVGLTVFAWFESPRLAGPSVVLQSGEYDEGSSRPISGVASVISGVSRLLSFVPVLRPYALASEMVSSAIGGVASRLGYSNTPLVHERRGVDPGVSSNMAVTTNTAPMNVIAMDEKNEISIDSAFATGSPEDELSFSSILGRECIIGTMAWQASQASEAIIGGVCHGPVQWQESPLVSGTVSYYLTTIPPAAALANMHSFWSGEVTYKFRFLATKFHRGRLRISYDPGFDTGHNQVYQLNTVVDLAQGNEASFVVPFMHASPWHSTGPRTYLRSNRAGPATSTVYQGATFNGNHNGFLGRVTLQVVNPLSAPMPASDIRVVVYADYSKLRFAYPRDFYTEGYGDKAEAYSFELCPSAILFQSGVVDERGDGPSHPDDTKLYMGEVITSVRQLIQRVELYVSETIANVNDTSTVSRISLPRFPFSRGATNDTVRSNATMSGVTGLITPVSYIAVRDTFLTFFRQCFVGVRGGVNYRAVGDNSHPMLVTRSPEYSKAFASQHGDAAPSGLYTQGCTGGGCSLVAGSTDYVNKVRVPMMCDSLFLPGNSAADRVPDFSCVRNRDAAKEDGSVAFISQPGRASATKNRFYAYVSASHDTSFVYFLNIPTIRENLGTPVLNSV